MTENIFYKNNRFHQIKGFCLVVQEGNVSKAANKMGLTQGAISLQIKALERDLGVELFTRVKNRISLSKEGEIFYESAIKYIQGVEELFNNFSKTITLNEVNIINIGASYASICYILPKFLKKFEIENPKVDFKVRNLLRSDAFTRLKDGKVDMLFYAMQDDDVPNELDFFPIAEYKTVLLMHPKHKLAKNKNIDIEDIKKFKILKLDKNFITVPYFDEVAKIHKLRTKIEFEMANYEVLKKFVEADLGIAIVSQICLEGEDKTKIISKDLSNYFLPIKYGLLIRKGQRMSNISSKFFEMMIQNSTLNIEKKSD